MIDSVSLPLLSLIFAGCAAAIWFAGIRLSDITDILATRFGFGEAFGGLIVLALVFSAIPLPFTADMTGAALYGWWALVTLLYLTASDFFQVVRLAAFVQFWRLYHPDSPAARFVD